MLSINRYLAMAVVFSGLAAVAAGQAVSTRSVPVGDAGLATNAEAVASSSAIIRLMRGSEPVRGLPGFGANALDGLYGEYSAETDGIGAIARNAAPIRVWATRERLFFNDDAWSVITDAPYRRLVHRDSVVAGYSLFAAERPFTVAPIGLFATANTAAVWSVLCAFPTGLTGGETDRFMAAFLDRFNFDINRAALPTDVSFPAFLGTVASR